MHGDLFVMNVFNNIRAVAPYISTDALNFILKDLIERKKFFILFILCVYSCSCSYKSSPNLGIKLPTFNFTRDVGGLEGT